MTFTFGADTRLLTGSSYDTEPANIDRSLKLSEDRSASLSFKLLNPKDTVYLGFVCSGELSAPKVTARIEGVQAIREENWEQVQAVVRFGAKLWMGMSLFLVGLVLAIVIWLHPFPPSSRVLAVQAAGYLSISVLWLYFQYGGRNRQQS